jgi:hypothetical protein
MRTKKAKALTKRELAEMAAGAMNLLMDMRCYFRDDMSDRQEDDFNALAAMLPEGVREDYWNNSTLDVRDFGLSR